MALPALPPTTCEVCGAMQWRNASPCACAIVERGGSVLLVHRAHDPWRGMWSAPGGFCVYDEHPIDAVVRETREETGVAIEVTGFLGIWIDEYADAPAPDNDTISVAYYTAIPSGTVETTPEAAEVIEARWFAWNEIPAALAPPGTLRAVLDAWHEAGQSSTPLLDRPT